MEIGLQQLSTLARHCLIFAVLNYDYVFEIISNKIRTKTCCMRVKNLPRFFCTLCTSCFLFSVGGKA